MLVVLARVLEVRQEPRDANQRYERALELLRSLPGSTAAEQLHKTYAQFSEYLERQGESQRAFEMLKEAYKSTL
jgi:tetratricopeptide (TPR) repeat protein